MINILNKKINMIVILFLVFSCRISDDKVNSKVFKTDKYNTITMVEQIVENVIFPEINEFNSAIVALHSQTIKFSNTITEGNLKVLQEKWMKVAKKWSRVHAFNIGDVSAKGYFRKFMSKVNEQAVDDYLKSNKPISMNLGADMKSIFAIEYLLFSEDLHSEKYSKNIDSFKKLPRKIEYLKAVVSDLVSLANDFQKDWQSYKIILLNKKVEELSIDNPLNILLNGVYNVVHYARETKIGKSSGFEKKKYIDVSVIEAKYSKQTLALIKENVAVTKRLFFDKKVISFSDKIRYVTKNDEIIRLLRVQFKKIEQSISSFDKSLYDTLGTKTNLEKVNTLYNELMELEKVFLVDLKSVLSFIDTGTDGDGD